MEFEWCVDHASDCYVERHFGLRIRRREVEEYASGGYDTLRYLNYKAEDYIRRRLANSVCEEKQQVQMKKPTRNALLLLT